ncbi:helix-turn-helix transcriptional regulator [Arthrobacter sp. 1P04PC]|uniref:helix-turn-helix domain-containing protein n=1 Tax=unclassified Arthrobacter TaxID=235627 RepID=UPI0039A28F06
MATSNHENLWHGLTTTLDGRRYRIGINMFARVAVEDAEELFGERARMRREYLNLSQQAVAAYMTEFFKIPWHQTVVAKIESGKRRIKLNEAMALAYIYGQSLDHLAGGISGLDRSRLIPLDEEGENGEHSEEA